MVGATTRRTTKETHITHPHTRTHTYNHRRRTKKEIDAVSKRTAEGNEEEGVDRRLELYAIQFDTVLQEERTRGSNVALRKTVNSPAELRVSISGFRGNRQAPRQTPDSAIWRASIANDWENDMVVLTTSTRFRKTRGERFAVADLETCDSTRERRVHEVERDTANVVLF